MKYKVGDKVRIVSKKTGVCWNSEGKMDKWLGKVMTIRDTLSDSLYSMKEDDGEFYGDGWCWHEEMIEGLAPELPGSKVVITTDGKTTLARLYDGKKVIKRAEAKCSPHDEFNFNVGAELAFSRLMGKDSAPSTEWKVVKRKAKAGDYIRLTCKSFDFTEVGDILKVHRRTPYVVKVLDKDHPRRGRVNVADNYEWSYAAREYEVVEPVKKPYEKETPKGYNGKVVCIKTTYPWWTVGKVYEVKDGIITADNGRQYPQLDNYRYKDAEDVRHAGCTNGENYNRKNEFIPLAED